MNNLLLNSQSTDDDVDMMMKAQMSSISLTQMNVFH